MSPGQICSWECHLAISVIGNVTWAHLFLGMLPGHISSCECHLGISVPGNVEHRLLVLHMHDHALDARDSVRVVTEVLHITNTNKINLGV